MVKVATFHLVAEVQVQWVRGMFTSTARDQVSMSIICNR